MKAYRIKKINNNQPLWSSILPITLNEFPWYQTGNKQDTSVQVCANEQSLFIYITAHDKHSFAQQTQLNHMLICEDSCVEFFFSPSGVLGSSYVNLEVNCCGTLHIAYGEDRNNRTFISPEIASLIKCKTSIRSPTKGENDNDDLWSVELTIPFDAITQLTGSTICRDRWFANFYRCGGRQDPQYATWNKIKTDEPDYHRPEYFGQLSFEH